MILFYVLLIVVGIPFFVMFVSVLIGIPCLPTHKRQAKVLLELCNIGPGVKMVDLGSGHGRLIIMAGMLGAEVVGYELNPFLVLISRCLVKKLGLEDRVKIRWQSFYRADIKDADVVTTFLFPKPMIKLADGLFKDLKSGALVASYTFPIKNWQPIIVKEGVSIYRILTK